MQSPGNENDDLTVKRCDNEYACFLLKAGMANEHALMFEHNDSLLLLMFVPLPTCVGSGIHTTEGARYDNEKRQSNLMSKIILLFCCDY